MTRTADVPQLVPTRGGRLGVWTWGDGEPVVLLHPLAMSGEVWRPLGQALGDGFGVFAPDLRGHGASSWDGEPFTVDDLADDLADALDALGLPVVHLLGLSMGGSVAVTFAGRFPDRVRSLVLADTTAWYGEDAPAAWAQRAARAVVPRAEQLPFQLERWFSPGFVIGHADEVDRVVGIFLATNSAVHAAASTALGALDARALLPAITAPTLVLVGEGDQATPPAMATVLAGSIPGAELRVLPDLRHFALIERPELATVIADHLRHHAAPSTEEAR